MRTTTVFVAGILAVALAPNAAAAVRVGNVATVGPFAADSQGSALISDRGAGGPAGHPYLARQMFSKNDRGDSIGALGFSSLPFQISLDPRSGSQKRVFYSQCLTPESASSTTCAIVAQDLVGGAGQPVAVSDTTTGTQDRLPSAYGGAVAFARSVPGGSVDQLRYTASGSRTSQVVRGGPRGVGAARLTGIALRGSTIAFVWKWKPSSERTRYSLITQRVDQSSRRTVTSLDSMRGRIIGPVWRGSRVVFGVRKPGSSRFYDYDPSGRRFRSAAGPDGLASFAVASSTLLWQTATGGSLSSGVCGGSGCPLMRGGLPSFKRSRAPN